uniref:Uncharacterized protein n=1 Tax=Pipistrellus kuhlii TaxID=59472 RepID=A0A7J7T1E7_PIPKU|nr:hypothetical protein mPipKuh1_009725 [Pipistrellus kuhlii]
MKHQHSPPLTRLSQSSKESPAWRPRQGSHIHHREHRASPLAGALWTSLSQTACGVGRGPLAATRLPGDTRCGPVTPKPGRRWDPRPSLCPPPKCSSHGPEAGEVQGEGNVGGRRTGCETCISTPQGGLRSDPSLGQADPRSLTGREPVQLVGRPAVARLASIEMQKGETCNVRNGWSADRGRCWAPARPQTG